jgi:hypothetical protein
MQDLSTPALSSSPEADDSTCKQCGNELAPGEGFCGVCGAARSSIPHNDLQSKWATLWNLKKVSGQIPAADSTSSDSVIKPLQEPEANVEQANSESFILPPPETKTPPLAEIPELAIPIVEPPPEDPPEPSEASPEPTATAGSEDALQPAVDPGLTAASNPEHPEWLHSIAVSPPAAPLVALWQKHKGFLKKHPGDLALGAAAVLFLITILWAVSSNGPTTSADSGSQTGSPSTTAPAKPKRKQVPAVPKLSFMDQLLVSLGLAEPPPAPSYSGNPNVPVWVDVHTALYYCPGADLYGKTPQGKIASQHDAQLDQFEPAFRKVCD